MGRFLTSLLLCLALSLWAGVAIAQDGPPTSSDIGNLRAQIEDLSEATEEERTALSDSIATTQSTLELAAAARKSARDYARELETAPTRVAELDAEIERLRDAPAPEAPMADRMDNSVLLAVEQRLAEAEAQFTLLNADLDRVGAAQERIVSRPSAIAEEIDQARTDLSRIDEELEQLSGGEELTVADDVRVLNLRASRDLRLAQLSRLEAERTSLAARSQVLQLEGDRLAIEQSRLAETIEGLQSLTGQRRLNRAAELAARNENVLADVPQHPLLIAAAARNSELVARLEVLALTEANLPRKRADVQQSLTDVTSNLRIATQLTELGDLDRRSGETLRRLRASVPVIATIVADTEQTREAIIMAGTDQLLARDELRQLPLRRIDPDAMLAEFRRSDPSAPELSDDAEAGLRRLFDVRRTLLREISEAATSRADDAAKLKILQDDLLDASTQLQTRLDQNLLWLPSAEMVFTPSWPGALGRGALKLMQPSRGFAVLTYLRDGVLDFWWLFALAVIFAGFLFTSRHRLRDNIAQASSRVGRVREDGYFLTPRIVLESVLLALPVPVIVFTTGWILGLSETGNPLVLDTGEALRVVAAFLLACLVLRAWAQKGGVFQRHIRIPDDLRRGIQIESRWFIPVASVALAILIATHSSRDIDIYEGVSLAAFLVFGVSVGLFAYRQLWGRRDAFAKTLDTEGVLFRYRKVIVIVAVGVPFLTVIAAALGYFATAESFLLRYLLTAGLVTLTFILAGMLRRTVNITHRRLSLKQAMEKREAAVETRRREREMAEAAEEGEVVEIEAPPPVDYEQIDLEQTSRQTRQLIGTAVVIGFFALAWMIWRDLLPALSALDSVELYRNGTRMEGEGNTAIEVTQYITLWDILQALVTVVITVLAARNLPGFLEIFVLNRTQLDKGIRYAIVTVLGYIIIGIGIFTALNQVGVQWGQLGFIVAALSLGIGFGLQAIIANFVSGLIILFERPIRVGDYVTVGDQSGTVSNIKIRATTLTDLDNKEILIPNQEFITTRVTNWTLTNSIIRLIIPVGIAYGSDTKRAQAIMLDVLQDETKILDKPPPQVIFVNFGDSSLDFELRVFIRTFEDRFPVINAVHTAVNLALEEAGIGIPFPQRDLHIIGGGGMAAPPVLAAGGEPA